MNKNKEILNEKEIEARNEHCLSEEEIQERKHLVVEIARKLRRYNDERDGMNEANNRLYLLVKLNKVKRMCMLLEIMKETNGKGVFMVELKIAKETAEEREIQLAGHIFGVFVDYSAATSFIHFIKYDIRGINTTIVGTPLVRFIDDVDDLDLFHYFNGGIEYSVGWEEPHRNFIVATTLLNDSCFHFRLIDSAEKAIIRDIRDYFSVLEETPERFVELRKELADELATIRGGGYIDGINA